MIEQRVAKCVMTGSVAIFALLVAFNNLVDYGSNFAFVQHVLSMDSTFPDNRLMDRAITVPALWHLAYAAIILTEAATGIAFALGAIALARHLRSDRAAFARARRFVYIGAALGFLLWFLGFMVVGGEWFLMWQSHTWNGQQAAVSFYLTILGVLIFVNQPEG